MQRDLELLQPQLKLAASETTAMMKVIEKETAQVEKTTALVQQDEAAAKAQAEAATVLKVECEADLAEALPALEGMKKLITKGIFVSKANVCSEYVMCIRKK